jgi:hypothetical protein
MLYIFCSGKLELFLIFFEKMFNQVLFFVQRYTIFVSTKRNKAKFQIKNTIF